MAQSMTPAQIPEFKLPASLENLEHLWNISHISSAFNYAGVTIMIWDMLLTMDMEVRLLWKTKVSFLKTAFLINRYVAPVVIFVNIYFLSGRAVLTNELYVGSVCSEALTTDVSHSCRGWFSVSAVVQIFCLASISFLFAFRLWAWYEVSARVLYALLFVWASSLISALSLVINLAGLHNAEIMYEPLFNVCITKSPVLWPQWLPSTIEHGIYAVFLLFNAMATPRSEQKAALAIIYRDGIVFYMLTFLVCLGSLLTWAFAPRAYMGFGLYPPWMVFQVGISRLLLNVKTSQIFATREQAAGQEDNYLETRKTPLRDMVSPHDRGINRTTRIVSHDSSNNGTSRQGEETGMETVAGSYFPSISKKQDGGEEGPGSQDGGDYMDGVVERQIRRIHPSAGRLRTRLWWLYRRSEIADIRIDVMQTDNPEDSEWGESSGGVKLSRLGRLDEWL